MFSAISNRFFGHSQVLTNTEINLSMRDDTDRLLSKYNNTTCAMVMFSNIYDIKIGLGTYKKNIGVENVTQLHLTLIKFLYEYQSAIPFGKMSYIQRLQPLRKYWFKSGFRTKTLQQFCRNIHELWVDEAIIFLDGKKEFTHKILAIYSELDYHYQFPNTHNRKDMQNWEYTMNQNGTIQHKSEKVTLQQVLGGLIMYQDGIYNDNGHTRNWGLYNSSFYNVVLFKVFGKIINDIRVQFNNDHIETDHIDTDHIETDHIDTNIIEIKLE